MPVIEEAIVVDRCIKDRKENELEFQTEWIRVDGTRLSSACDFADVESQLLGCPVRTTPRILHGRVIGAVHILKCTALNSATIAVLYPAELTGLDDRFVVTTSSIVRLVDGSGTVLCFPIYV